MRCAKSNQSGWEDQKFVSQFNARATMARLVAYYLTHPGTVWRRVTEGLNEAALQRARIGNYPKSAGKLRYERSFAFAAWSSLKTWVFWKHPWRFRIYPAALCASVPWLCCRTGGKRRIQQFRGAVCLSTITLLMLLVGCLGDVLDSIRHLFLFNPALDMLLLTGVAFATVTVPSRHGVLPVMPAQPGPAIKPAGRGTATAGKAFL